MSLLGGMHFLGGQKNTLKYGLALSLSLMVSISLMLQSLMKRILETSQSITVREEVEG